MILGESMARQTSKHGARTLTQALAAVGGVLGAGMAWAVNDMPGGPGVNQLNLTQGVTRIAADQWWIHNLLMIVCLAIFVAVFDWFCARRAASLSPIRASFLAASRKGPGIDSVNHSSVSAYASTGGSFPPPSSGTSDRPSSVAGAGTFVSS